MAAATLAQYNPTTAGVKTPAQIDMLVKGTQDMIIKRGELVNLMTDLTEYVGVNQLWKKHQAAFDGGLDWEFDLLLDQNHTAKFVGLYQDDTANHVEATIKGKVGPKFLNANYVYDVKEKALQSNRAIVIYNFIKGKMSQMYQSWYDLMEDAIWGAPAHKADALTPYGLKFWITRMRAVDPSTSTAYTASQIANGGFFGIDPQLATSAAKQRLSDVSRARHFVRQLSALGELGYAVRRGNEGRPHPQDASRLPLGGLQEPRDAGYGAYSWRRFSRHLREPRHDHGAGEHSGVAEHGPRQRYRLEGRQVHVQGI